MNKYVIWLNDSQVWHKNPTVTKILCDATEFASIEDAAQTANEIIFESCTILKIIANL